MSATYSIESRIHVTKWDANRQAAVEGWQITAVWASSGVRLPVFVPDDVYNPANVDAAIRNAGALDDQIAALGAAPSPPVAKG